MALSSCEAEYIAAAMAACQGVWLARLLAEVRGGEPARVKINVDNKSTISLCKNPMLHKGSKHIDTKYHFIRDCIEDGRIEVDFFPTGDQLADVLTKPLGRAVFQELRDTSGVVEVKTQTSGLGGAMLASLDKPEAFS